MKTATGNLHRKPAGSLRPALVRVICTAMAVQGLSAVGHSSPAHALAISGADRLHTRLLAYHGLQPEAGQVLNNTKRAQYWGNGWRSWGNWYGWIPGKRRFWRWPTA